MALGRIAPLLSLLLLASEPGPARAQAAGSSAASAICSASLGSLNYLGCSLAQQLLPRAAGAEVVVLELRSDRELPAAEALRQRLVDSVRIALGKPGAAGERSKLRLELRVEKSRGVLRVSAELRRAVGLWQRARSTRPGVEQQAFVELPLDAELRSYVPPPALVVSELLKLKAPERGIIALACGELEPGGGQELALASRSSVRVGRVVAGAFRERASVAWSKLSSVAPAPLREPIASLELTPGRLRVGLSDRRDGLELDAALTPKARFQGLLPVPGGGCLSRSGLGLSGHVVACTPSEAVTGSGLEGVLDAFAGSALARIGRELASGSLALPAALAKGRAAELGDVGAQLALGDADGDGTPELAYSSNTSDAAKDRLRLVSLGGARPTLRFELAAPSIGAIGICARPESASMAPIALVSGDELWLIR